MNAIAALKAVAAIGFAIAVVASFCFDHGTAAAAASVADAAPMTMKACFFPLL